MPCKANKMVIYCYILHVENLCIFSFLNYIIVLFEKKLIAIQLLNIFIYFSANAIIRIFLTCNYFLFSMKSDLIMSILTHSNLFIFCNTEKNVFCNLIEIVLHPTILLREFHNYKK